MADSQTVTLVSPEGGEVNVSMPSDVTNLVFGAGYKVKGGKTPDEAAAFLANKGAAADFIAQTAAAEGSSVPKLPSGGGKDK